MIIKKLFINRRETTKENINEGQKLVTFLYDKIPVHLK